MSREIWRQVPPEYRTGENPDELITVWRGDKIGREVTGMSCKLTDTDPETFVFEAAITEPPEIGSLVKQHCSEGSNNSPFISLTDKPDLAGRFSQRHDEAVYEITVPAHRLLVDPPGDHDTPLIEALAIGAIKPEDIAAVQIGVDPETNEIIWDRSQSWAQEDPSSS